MLATLVGNGAAWSVVTLPAIKVNSHRFQRLVKVRCDAVDGSSTGTSVPWMGAVEAPTIQKSVPCRR